jgi:hypothetical protein
LILNPRVKLSYFNNLSEEWDGGKDAATYSSETRDRYQSDYVLESEVLNASQTLSESDLDTSQSQGQKRSAGSAFVDDDGDEEYEAHLTKRAKELCGSESTRNAEFSLDCGAGRRNCKDIFGHSTESRELDRIVAPVRQ